MKLENREVYLSKVFDDIDASQQELVRIEFDSCCFKYCDFSDAIFNQCRFIDCEFIGSSPIS